MLSDSNLNNIKSGEKVQPEGANGTEGKTSSSSSVKLNEEDEMKDEGSSSSSSRKYLGDSLDFDTSSLRCFKQIELSSSSFFKHPLYYFPELEDPGIFEAFRYEPPLQIDNDVGRERYIRICKTLEIVPLKRVLNSLDQNELGLRFYGLRPKELRAIFHVLELNAYVKTLLLQDSWIDEDSARLLSNMLTQNETLTVLNLTQCELGPTGAHALNEGLQQSLTLRELDLSFNSIEDKGVVSLRPTLKNNESIRKINLGHNKLTSGCANTLQQFFTFHEVVQDVNLSWNTLCSDEAIKKIATGLKANTHLVSLNLSWNGLESRVAAREIGRYIRESMSLEFLDLSNNGFKAECAMILKGAINASMSLKHVKLGNNPMKVEEASAFGTMLLQSEILEILDLENIYFPKSFNASLKKIKQAGKTLIYGGILGNFRVKGPSLRSVLLKRSHYLGLAPKKAKAKRDFGEIVLTLPTEPMDKAEFQDFVRKKRKAKMYDVDLLTEIRKAFPSGKTRIDTAALLSEYMKIYPDTKLPSPKPKKEKNKGKKAQSASSGSTTQATTESNLSDFKVSFTTIEDPPPSRESEGEDALKEKSSVHSVGRAEQVEVIEGGTGIDVKQSNKSATSEEQQSVKSSMRLEPHKSSEKTKSSVRIREEVKVYETPGS